MAGLPVYSQPGRNGGWQLLGGARTDLSGLNAAEARALFLVAGPSPASPELKAALRKLVRAYATGVDTDGALKAALNTDLDEMQTGFDQTVEKMFGSWRRALAMPEGVGRIERRDYGETKVVFGRYEGQS